MLTGLNGFANETNPTDLSFSSVYHGSAPEYNGTLVAFSGADTSRLSLRAHNTAVAASSDVYEDTPGTATSNKKLRTDFSWNAIPFTGYTFGGKFELEDEGDPDDDTDIDIKDASSVGFILAWNQTDYTQIEILYSRQDTELDGGGLFPDMDMDVEYIHIGGTILMNPPNRYQEPSKWQPFMSGGLGLARFDPEGADADTLNKFSLSFGGGVRFFPIERIGLYLSGRAYITFVDTEMAGRFGSGGNYVAISADTLWQFQTCAGLIATF